MAYDRFLIAPFDSGLDKSGSKWLIPEDAYTRLNNAWIYRGKLYKRPGSRYTSGTVLTSRLRIDLGYLGAGKGITDPATGDANSFVPGAKGKIGQMFSVGNYYYTVINATAGLQDMLSTGGATTAQFDCDNGEFKFIGATPSAHVFYYPANPVMGFTNYQTGAANNHPSYSFDTQFVYRYQGGSWDEVRGATTTPIFKGTNSKFFWTANWMGPTSDTTYLFVSNFNATSGAPALTDDDMYYWEGNDWHIFAPVFRNTGAKVVSARILLPFKDRFVLLDTMEQIAGVNTEHKNRCRYSAPGSPVDTSGYNWLEVDETNYRGAGWTDAATEEKIISAGFIKDRLIVLFERSVWELAFTGNNARPFIWLRINSELGAQSTFSAVIFDKGLLAVGNTGIYACNSNSVERIDSNIYADIFNIRTSDEGTSRVAGIRDFQSEVVYWSWPEKNQPTNASVYPAKILVYNYQNATWSYNDDVVTAWGYFEQDTGDIWATDTEKWEDDKTTWASGISHAENKEVIAGNQQGFTFIVDKDLPYNENVIYITDISYVAPTITLTIVDHTLSIGDYIYIPSINGMSISGTNVYRIASTPSTSTVTIDATDLVVTGTYTGNSYASRVSRLDVLSKQWNPYIKQASNFTITKIDFCVQKTATGSLTVDYSPNSGISADDEIVSMVNASVATNSALGSNILETSPYPLINFESLQERLWHPVYFQTHGNCIQIRMYYSDTDMVNPDIWGQPFVLEGLVLYTKPMSYRLE